MAKSLKEEIELLNNSLKNLEDACTKLKKSTDELKKANNYLREVVEKTKKPVSIIAIDKSSN